MNGHIQLDVQLKTGMGMPSEKAHTALSAVCIWLIAAVGVGLGDDAFDAERLEKETIVAACDDPMQLAVLPEGGLLYIERSGTVKLVRSASEPNAPSVVVGKIPVAVFGEVGLLGLAIDRNFAHTGWLYLFYCPSSKPHTMRLSRFTLFDNQIDTSSEAQMLEYPIDVEGAIHMGGGLWMDEAGDLWIGTGDNCPPIPELPVDIRKGRENFDAFRTSANTQDLRGKVLRIHPEADGSYSIPAGNLFSDALQGRGEVYAMGCRNPFRLTVDDVTKSVMWGDVGPNIDEGLLIGRNGYDEFHRATEPGNFGWPICVGPNEPYRNYDFAKRLAGELFDLQAPTNSSPNNTGAVQLPQPQPAVIWYPSTNSDQFPSLGSGGRSAMSGPVYRFQSDDPLGPHLHDRFQGGWFIYDWTRNWIQVVTLNDHSQVAEIEPFMPQSLFRKPIDIKIGSDGSLYVIEFGDKWGNNTDSQISRIVYRRGNRKPTARLLASRLAGREPLQVRAFAGESSDPDDDPLNFAWELDGQTLAESNDAIELALTERGSHRLKVTVRDSSGAHSHEELLFHVGNEPPRVAIQSPLHGSFFDWGDTIHYRVEVNDAEDGSTDPQPNDAPAIPSARIVTSHQPLTRRNRNDLLDPGLVLMRSTTCFSCHTTKMASAGPSYDAISRKYLGANDEVVHKLAGKIVAGGTGVWGDKPMPAHPQHTHEDALHMVRWVLSLATSTSSPPQPGQHGFFRAEHAPGAEPSVVLLTAEYTDNGVASDASAQLTTPSIIPPLRGESVAVLHARRKRAAFADHRLNVSQVDVFEGGVGQVARIAPQGWIAFDDLRLSEIDRVTVTLQHRGTSSGRIVLRENTADGRELAAIDLPANHLEERQPYRDVDVAIEASEGLVRLYLVYELESNSKAWAGSEEGEGDEKNVGSTERSTTSISWIEFHPSQETLMRKKLALGEVKRILLLPTELDHPWATHMYGEGCRLLAATLNLTPGVEAVVSPDLDWPRDESLLEDVDAIVYYSRPAGDILLSSVHRGQAEALLKRGVGFTAIHWSTGAAVEVGPKYESILGAWFNFEFSGLSVEQQTLQQIDPHHPVCRGWDEYLLRDEFYLNLRFHPDAVPLLKVRINDQDQTVAWAHHRNDGGRSFGTTLGHFHDNFSDARFRRMLANGILWTAHVDIPESGLPVDIPNQLLRLDNPTAASTSREWSFDELRPLLLNRERSGAQPRSFASGKRLYQKASCAACHAIGSTQQAALPTSTGSESVAKLGPDLTGIRVRLAAEDDPRGALLRSILEPSARVDEPYRSEIFQLDDGSILSGLVKQEMDGKLLLATNPQQPEELRELPLEHIEARRKSELSMMPAGLLNSLNEEEILDLVTYVEAEGNADYIAYRHASTQREAWADERLPVQDGLRLWLDASRMNPARQAQGFDEINDGNRVSVWPDASGHHLDLRQREWESQPVYRSSERGDWVEFDGTDDCMIGTTSNNIKTLGFTAMLIVAPNHNRGWPGLLSANAFGRNDYQSGFNIDLMYDVTDSWQTVMSEGPGYPGVVNMMTENHPWKQFQIVTLRSQPGEEGVLLKINGRPQRTRPRPEQWIAIDELTLGARYWSNDPGVPPHNRGFLSGRVAQVLLYDRALLDDEMIANEVFLWNSNTGLLDPTNR